jgi:hypothetical protein
VRAVARFLAAGLVLLLAACATPQASITFGDPANPTRITAMSGLSSRDAAHVAATQAFYSAKASASKDVLKIKAQPGQQVTISGLEELTVSTPAASGLPDQAPIAGPTEFSQNVKAVGGLVREIGGVVIPLKALDATADVLKQAATPTVVNAPPTLVVRPEVVNPLIVRP